ncbi:winged helix-turn-helix domain-containing protein [Neorhizobium tomejilense]|uniref:winged helix-turn-helix domain-containing protein n=1 Tax=Neorhizobium tomejilense TaxID=2093828 RepID=UPI000CF9A4E6|nr:helix-turn-helix domain-containing protein [Neorhizobium tomejilense]
MNVQPRIQIFTCPCCGGFIGEAAPISTIVESMNSRVSRRLLERLGRKPGASVSRDAIIDYCYSDDPTGGPERADNVFRVMVCRLRKVIEPYGWTIQCVTGRGPSSDGAGALYRLIPTEARQ